MNDQILNSSHALLRQGNIVFTWKSVFLVLKSNFLLIYSFSESVPFRTDASSLLEVIFIDSNWKVENIKFISITGKDQGFQLVAKKSSNTNRIENIIFCISDPDCWVIQIAEIINRTEKSPTLSPIRESNSLNSIQFYQDPKKIILCSYNLNFGLCDLSRIGEEEMNALVAIQATSCDILCLQETTSDWEFFLRTRLKHSYIYSHFDHSQLETHDGKPLAGGIGILSKFPIESVKVIESPCKWFPAQLARITTPYGTVQVLNLHLRPPLSDSALPTPQAFFSSKGDRLLECLYYASFLDKEIPLVVCGDLNEGHQGNSVLFWVNKFELKSALNEHSPNSITWWWDLPGGVRITKTYDHIFSSSHLNCTDCLVIPAGESDHFPVVAHFEFI